RGEKEVPADQDTALRVWDVATGRVTGIWPGHPNPVRSLCFAPNGSALLSQGLGSETILWDTATGKPLRRFGSQVALRHWIVLGCDGRPHCPGVFHPDGSSVILPGRDWTYHRYSLTSGGEEGGSGGTEGKGDRYLFTPDGKSLVVGGEGIRVLDVRTG